MATLESKDALKARDAEIKARRKAAKHLYDGGTPSIRGQIIKIIILGLIDAFAGGAFSQASILALGIMPYISASIFMQLMTILVPQLQKVQKEGESGRNKINQWTRFLTVGVTAFQAAAYIGGAGTDLSS